jgi:hypothetical protein
LGYWPRNEAWNCVVTDEISNNIIHHTNQYILIIQPNLSRESDARLTVKIEIKSFICAYLERFGETSTVRKNRAVLTGMV